MQPVKPSQSKRSMAMMAPGWMPRWPRRAIRQMASATLQIKLITAFNSDGVLAIRNAQLDLNLRRGSQHGDIQEGVGQ